ncbi:hypothetical protein CAJAP_10394 [Camponotus japonicus]
MQSFLENRKEPDNIDCREIDSHSKITRGGTPNDPIVGPRSFAHDRQRACSRDGDERANGNRNETTPETAPVELSEPIARSRTKGGSGFSNN